MAEAWDGRCLQELLVAQAARTPDLPAVSFEDGSTLTYAEFESRAGKIAAALRQLTVGLEDFVGVRLSRSVGAVVGIYGVLKAGATYVPVDPKFPTARQEHIISRSGLRVMLVGRGQAARARLELPSVAFLEIGPMGEVLGSYGPGAARPEVGPSGLTKAERVTERSLAYVLFTSGSTGLPKGVAVEHRGVVNMLRFFRDELQMGPGDTVLGLTTFCFDISVLELFLPLATGARLCVASAATQGDPAAIIDLLEAEDITLLQATPATFEMLMAAGWRGGRRVHCVCGGEAFRLSLLPLVQACATFRNSYGPTEATVYSTSFTIPRGFSSSTSVPIGQPLPGTRAYVLDEQLRPLPAGHAGELYVGGVGVARGYLGQPELTAERFMPDPFVGGHATMYRTGDLCAWECDEAGADQIAYLGRMDSQVKINGFRIELGEIEAVLQAAHPGVGAAVVTCREDLPGAAHKGLVAYYVRKEGGAALPEEALRAACAAKLPPYMLPRFIVPLAALPLSTSGKVDRKALPPVNGTKAQLGAVDEEGDTTATVAGAGWSAPSSPSGGRAAPTLADALASLMSEQAGVSVGPASSMEAVGLDSMGAALLLARLAAKLGGFRIAPAEVYGHETVADFAAHLERRMLHERPGLLGQLGLMEMREAAAMGGLTKPPLASRGAAAGPSPLMTLTDALTGLRGVLILWVVAEHFGDRAWQAPFGMRFASNTWMFVVLSGFSVMLQRLTAPQGRAWSVGSFLQSKAVGLFPIYYTAIMLTLPRYIAVTRDPRAFMGTGWQKTGPLRTDYSDWKTYAWDWTFLLSGMQTWVDEINHRSMNTLYYASLQWSLYLVFALLAWGSQQRAFMRLLSTCEERLGGPGGAFTTVLLVSHVTLWAGAMLHPSMLQTFSPLLYLPAFLSGMCAARLLLHLAAAARAPAARTPGWHDMLIAHGSDVLSACLVWLVFAPWGLGTLDTVVALCVIPPLMCVCVLLLGLHVLRPGGRRSTPLLLWLLYDTEAAVNLGKLSFAIYLYHECLGDVYFQMGVKGLFLAWHGLFPPAHTPWETVYEVFISPWMSTQSGVLKAGALALAICMAWVVTHYVTGHGLIQLLAAWERGAAWVGGCLARREAWCRERNVTPRAMYVAEGEDEGLMLARLKSGRSQAGSTVDTRHERYGDERV